MIIIKIFFNKFEKKIKKDKAHNWPLTLTVPSITRCRKAKKLTITTMESGWVWRRKKKSVQRYITNSPHPKTMDLLCDHRPLLTCNQQQREGAGKDQQADSDLWATRHNLEPNIKHTIFTSRGPASTRHTAAPPLDTWRQRFVVGEGKRRIKTWV